MTTKSLRKECADHLSQRALKDKRILALEGDLCESTMSAVFKQKVPSRHLEMGIAEQNMVGVAAGLATCGKIPFVHSFACFISMRTCEQIRTSICYPKLNVKFIVTHGGIFAGSASSTHHAIEDLSIMRSIPNMTVISPGDALEMHQAIDAALEYAGPVYIRIAKDDAEDVFSRGYTFEIGKAVTVIEGNDASIVTTGAMLSHGIQAAAILKDTHKINIRVVHCASIKPLDKTAVLKAAQETRNVITLEEHSIIGGLGSAVSEIMAEAGAGKLLRIGINDRFCSAVGTQAHLFGKESLTVEDIVRRIVQALQ